MVSASEIEDAVLATLELWFPTYLAEEERQQGMRKGSLPAPQNYINRNSFDTLEGEQLPKVVVLSEGLNAPPVPSNRGLYHAVWRVGVGVATAAKTEDLANRMVKAYGAAVRGLLLQKSSLDGSVDIINLTWLEETYPDLPVSNQIMLFKAAQVFFGIDVENVASRYGGPPKPTIDPPPPYPEVETVDIDMDIIDPFGKEVTP